MALKFDEYDYSIGEQFLSPLINGDHTGLEDDEEQIYLAWLEKQPDGVWEVIDEEGSFQRDEVTGLMGTCYDVKLWVLKEEGGVA